MIDVMENKVLGPAIRQGREEGRAEGKAEGKAEGERAIVSRLMERKFGRLPREVADRIATASESELLLWSDRVLVANSIAEIFGPTVQK